MKVRNLTNNDGDAIRNQFVITGEQNGEYRVTFQSYDSAVCTITPNEIIFGRDWDYSNTTRKHLYSFLSEYGVYNAKGKDVEKAIQQGHFDPLFHCSRKVLYDESMR